MTSPASPPNRRRRKLILAFVMVFGLLVSWWYWPRGDNRLIGQWTIVFPNWNTQNENKSPVREMMITFRRNGTGSLGWPGARKKTFFRWSFDGKTLSLGSSDPAVYGSQTLNKFAKAYEMVTGNRWELGPWSLVVDRNGQDSITFDQAKSRTPWSVDFRPTVPWRMARVPE
jgi:hypothetical protein